MTNVSEGVFSVVAPLVVIPPVGMFCHSVQPVKTMCLVMDLLSIVNETSNSCGIVLSLFWMSLLSTMLNKGWSVSVGTEEVSK
jgi:hypothetical protein